MNVDFYPPDFRALFLWELEVPHKKPGQSFEMQALSKQEPSKKADSGVFKLRHQEITNKLKGIKALHANLADLGEDMRNTILMLTDFLNISIKSGTVEPVYGDEIQRKTFQYLLDQKGTRQFSEHFNLFLKHQGKEQSSPLEYFFLSEWDSHQLFASLDFNNQIVVMEKVIQLMVLETFLSLPVGVVLALQRPVEYSIREWERHILEYLKIRGIFREEHSEDSVNYHLNLSSAISGPKTIKNLYTILVNYQPFESIDLSNNTIDQKSYETLTPWIKTAKKVYHTNTVIEG